MGSTTYKASFDNMVGTSVSKELSTHGLISGTPNYGSRATMYPGSASSLDAIQLRDEGQFKLALLNLSNFSATGTAALGVEIKMGDGNYYKLFDFNYVSKNGFFNLINSESPLYFNGSDVEMWSQRGGGGASSWTASHAEYIIDA